jgi:ribosomal protein L40E
MRCPNCGTENRPDLRFCEQCGTLLEAAALPGVEEARSEVAALQSCPRCGARSRAAARFCRQCGTPLETIEVQPEVAALRACPRCGAQNPPTLRFCEQCGTPLEAAALPGAIGVQPEVAALRACPRCGAQNPPTLRFCEQCGTPLEAAALPGVEKARPEVAALRACPRCGARSPAAARFCRQCGAPLGAAAPLAEPSPAVPLSRRRPRWIGWVAAGAALILVAIVGFSVLSHPKPTPSGEQAAIDVATLIVEEAFPEYAGAQRTVTEWEAGDGREIYVVSYSVEADPAKGEPYPRGLNIYFDPETRQVSIEEMD